jgi:hypothetical protein
VTALEDVSDLQHTTLAQMSRELERLRQLVVPLEFPPEGSSGDDMLP